MRKAEKLFSMLISTAAIVGALWLFVRFLFPWTAPLLLAFAVAAAMELPVRFLTRHRFSRSAAAGVMTLTVLGLLICTAIALTGKAVTFAASFATQVPELVKGLGAILDRVQSRIDLYVASAPEAVGEYLRTATDSVGELFTSLPGMLSRRVLDAVGKAAQHSPDTLLFTVTAGIGSYFISASFPQTLTFLSAQLPDEFTEKLRSVRLDFRGSFGGFLRAQLILMAMTFFELTIAFLLLKIDGAVGIAALTALVDALPVFGVGTVLLPWAAYCLILRDMKRGLGLVLCWALVTLVRSCTQAKLLGDQIGLDPLASLLAIYVGWQVWGVRGMLLFPILLVTVQQLNDRGVVKLWK